MISTNEILGIFDRAYSVPWDDDQYHLSGMTMETRIFSEGDEVALYLDKSANFRKNRSVQLSDDVLIYIPNYQARYCIMYMFWGDFSEGNHELPRVSELSETTPFIRTVELVNKRISGETIEWHLGERHSYFSLLDDKLEGYCEYKAECPYGIEEGLELFPERGFCRNGVREGYWENKIYFNDNNQGFPGFRIHRYEGDEITETVFTHSPEDYAHHLAMSKLPRLRQEPLGLFPMSALDWDDLKHKYDLGIKDACFVSFA